MKRVSFTIFTTSAANSLDLHSPEYLHTMQSTSTTLSYLSSSFHLSHRDSHLILYLHLPSTVSNFPAVSSALPSSPPASGPFVPPHLSIVPVVAFCYNVHVFDLQPTSYGTDKSRTAYTMNLLRGKAEFWDFRVWRRDKRKIIWRGGKQRRTRGKAF